ncbi:MAG: ParB N-terminal domain-containing protein [Phormidium sp.]
MKLSTSLVAVRRVTSNVPRSTFPDDEIEKVAKLIVETEGIINPIIVRRTSLQSYEVVDGHFEYYAAARAREIDLARGEMVSAYIIEDEKEEFIIEQIKLLRKPGAIISPDPDSVAIERIENRLTNLESRLEKRIDDILQKSLEKQQLEIQVKELRNQIGKNFEPLEVFNNVNKADLAFRLKTGGLSESKAAIVAEIIEKLRQKEPFKSLNDVVERVKIKNAKREEKAISIKKMLEIIDTWSCTSFN